MPNYIPINRAQMEWGVVDLESLVEADHPVRAIWDMSGRLDLSRFEQAMHNDDEQGGRPCWAPRLLFSVWVYGYSQGIASARALERLMEHEPALRWLCGGQRINHHTLSDFRVSDTEKLEDLIAQLLAALDQEQLIDLHTVAHDGTKIQARASRYSFHRVPTLRDRVKVARKLVRALDEQAAAGDQTACDEAKQVSRRRAAEEKLKRMEYALRKLEREQSAGKDNRRISTSEPEARKMKQPDGGWVASYNVQISTEAKHRFIVGVRVTDARSDTNELGPALDVIRKWCRRQPRRVLADGGYSSRENVAALEEQNIELVAPWKDDDSREAGAAKRAGRDERFRASRFPLSRDGESLVCPEGKTLTATRERKHHGQLCVVYEARPEDCAECPSQSACCGKRGGARRIERVRENEAMQSYLQRMSDPQTQQIYRKRSELAEFPHMWIKGHWNFRRFSVWGKLNAAKEAIWAAMAYNIQHWIRLTRQPQIT